MTQTDTGYNFGGIVAHSMAAIDAHHETRSRRLVEMEGEISHRLDCIMSALSCCYKQIQDPTSDTPANLEAIKKELNELRDFYRTQGLNPDEGYCPIDDLIDHLHAMPKDEVDTLTRHLESYKRQEQNRLPLMMGDFQLMVQLYDALVKMHQAMQENAEKEQAFIIRKSGI